MQTMAADTQGQNWLRLSIKGIFINILEAGSLNETMSASTDVVVVEVEISNKIGDLNTP